MADVLCLGEILVDWVCTTRGASLSTADNFKKAPGGAPANVAVGLARQGVDAAFIGRVSADAFGNWLHTVLSNENIDISCSKIDAAANTRMAYVLTTETGDRELADFSRVSCADARLEPNDIKPELFNRASWLHFGSISLISEPARSATTAAISMAKSKGMIVSYDPNVRLPLWPSADECKRMVRATLHQADCVKINQEELEFLTGSRDDSSAEQLRRENNLAMLIITRDSNGAQLFSPSGNLMAQPFPIDLVEATGAGDAFTASIIATLLPHIKEAGDKRAAMEKLSMEFLASALSRANAVGAITCQKAGAIPALPTTSEIDSFLATREKRPCC